MTNYAIAYLPLDDFMIQFLNGAFPQPRRTPYFSFPRSHDLENALQVLVKKSDSPPTQEGLAVQFSLPEWKADGKHYDFTQKSIGVLKRRIRNYYSIVAHDFLADRRNEGYEIKDCIYMFLQKYEIADTDTNFERVKKDFDRWRNRQAVKKYRKMSRKKTQDCPADS